MIFAIDNLIFTDGILIFLLRPAAKINKCIYSHASSSVRLYLGHSGFKQNANISMVTCYLAGMFTMFTLLLMLAR